MKGYRFSKFIPQPKHGESAFDNLLDIFLQLVSITGGDVSEALSWLTNLDKQYNITNDGYGIGDFIDELGVVYNSKTSISNVRRISSARGASMLIKKKIFEKLGHFDESFFVSFEDVDLGWRSWILGYRVVIAPNSIVYHSAGKTTSKLSSESSFHGLKNQLAMKITNFEPKFVFRSLLSFFIVYGLREIKIWLDYKIKHNTKMTSTRYEETIAKNPDLKVITKSILWILKNIVYLNKNYLLHHFLIDLL